MPTFILENNPQFKNPIQLSSDDQHHLTKVLRIKTDEIIYLTDNVGNLAEVKIKSVQPLELEILKISKGEPPFPITICLPLIDQDKLEFCVEKLCELNIKDIQLITTQRTQRQELSSAKINRLIKISQTAQKQSGRTWPLDIHHPKSILDIPLSQTSSIFVGSTTAQTTAKIALSNLNTIIFLGPEGGLTEDEMKHLEEQHAKKLNFGQTILRTETAAIVLSSLIKYHFLHDAKN